MDVSSVISLGPEGSVKLSQMFPWSSNAQPHPKSNLCTSTRVMRIAMCLHRPCRRQQFVLYAETRTVFITCSSFINSNRTINSRTQDHLCMNNLEICIVLLETVAYVCQCCLTPERIAALPNPERNTVVQERGSEETHSNDKGYTDWHLTGMEHRLK